MASRFAELATDEESEDDMAKERKLTLPEKAVYLESDALQIEMGNIVMRSGTGGTVLYEVARTNQHKDRAFRSHETDILTEEICMGWFEK